VSPRWRGDPSTIPMPHRRGQITAVCG